MFRVQLSWEENETLFGGECQGKRLQRSFCCFRGKGCDSGFGWLLATRLDALGFVVFAGCLAPDREDALQLKKRASPRLHVLELNVTDDWHVQRALSYIIEHLKEAGNPLLY